ncbi:SusC/RagA family TonB-linked outer membrane protein [Petrimonas mucosa]|jgi:TonB-linked SusC/RagA family outer membrane protein|uniref:SusC/RagA family TonB-linked outer membrane protein n=1 Tax=Petrimonas mucosa TaxID=1642646 RepID=UPI0023F0CD2C|nr:TonB-dependent receptor [Petrimonas mucosa]MDD3561954.1 TonB-dependent receptor [Petrimonas mucosa]
MKRKLTMFLTLFFVGLGVITAQTQVRGTVVDEAGEPAIGATVQVKGTTTGTVTDIDGNFTLSAPAGGRLIVSYVGYETQEVPVSPNVRVVLKSDSKMLEEVVVVAYGTVTREAKTGAVSTVSGANISDAPVVSMDKALGGKIAGVSITSSSGQPGASSSIRIRGTSSINAGNNPLWVVDGIPVLTGNTNDFLNTGNALASISPNDIESITVLKDAAAASIYGSRAANGVILVTTKSGKDGRTSFSARAKYGASWLANDNGFGIMNAEQLLTYQRDAAINAGYNPDNPTDPYYRPKELLSRPLTNWMDHLTRLGNIQEYEINATGSNAKAKYYSSLAYNKTEGVFYGVDLNKITGRINADYKLTNKLETGARVNLAYSDGNDVPMQSLYYSNPVFAGMMILPWTPAYDEEGKHNVGIIENSNTNPRATAEYDDQYGKSYQLLGNIYLQYKPIQQITLKTTNAIETVHGDGRRYWSPETNEGSATLQATMNKYVQLTTSNTATYNDLINDDHSVRVLLGQEAMKYTDSFQFIYAPDVNPDIPYAQTAPQSGVEGEQGYTAETLLSFFGMLDYNFAEKYYLQASLRFDGSSLFGSENRWGTFYSVGASWNIHKEDFMQDISFLNLLKLRASYGLNGNNNIAAYRSYGVYSSAQYNGATGMRPSRPANPYLSWEKNGTWNIGLDFTLFDKLDGNIDVYDRKTTDMLLDKNVPQTTGFSTNFLNIGSLRNRGVEFQLNYDIINNNNMKWDVGANIAFNRTKILELGDNEEIAYSEDSRLRHKVGKSMYSFRLLDYYGVDPTNGDALYRDASGNLTNDYNKARYIYPGSPEPKFIGGFNTSLSWNNFQLGAFFEFKGGNYVMLIERRYLESDGNQMSNNQIITALNYWKKPGDTGVNPKPLAGNSTNSYNFSTTRFLQRGDYLRVKDITLSYNLPTELLSKANVSGLKLYLSAQNIYTFHDVDWWDPERGVDGIGYGIYPMTKALIGGIELSF